VKSELPQTTDIFEQMGADGHAYALRHSLFEDGLSPLDLSITQEIKTEKIRFLIVDFSISSFTVSEFKFPEF
jgi:hypothetical protein